MNIAEHYYREFICLLNLSLLISIPLMLKFSSYESFDDTNVYTSFVAEGNGKIEIVNITICLVSVPVILEIIFDISYIITNKINRYHKIYDILLSKVLFVLAYVLAAILICSYANNPKMQ
jgi:hypothetical protein